MDRKKKKNYNKWLWMLCCTVLAAVLICAPAMAADNGGKPASSQALKNHWSSDGMSYYGSAGKTIKGVTVIREKQTDGTVTQKFYAFDKKGKLDALKTRKIRKAAKYEKKFEPLHELIGKAKSKSYEEGCYAGPEKNGETPYAGGKDGTYLYADYTVSTYKAPNGKEFYLGASTKKNKTKLSKSNHSIDVEKTAKEKGAKQRLIETDGKKSYCYDGNGKQHTGWQKIGSDVYFFKIADGKKGAMAKGTKVNGIALKSNGKAKVTSANKKKIRTLLLATQIVEKATKPGMSKSEKLKAVWKYYENNKNFQYRGSPTFHYSGNWDVDYAYAMLTTRAGSCYDMGAGFAYLANACGCKDCRSISSGGHGWCKIDGKICDPSWEKVDRKNSYFMVDPSLSGHNGRPRYASSERYVKKV